ncbi:hypothetical protein B0H14DRAFT_2565720 [Mycena olivaceomarginata]|nr:hypothetical protein B0H14DRAFT_2565720 [Mycena olivaceomarginata]
MSVKRGRNVWGELGCRGENKLRRWELGKKHLKSVNKSVCIISAPSGSFAALKDPSRSPPKIQNARSRGSDDDESGRAEEYLRQKPWGVDNDDRMNRLERGLASRHSPIVDMVVKSAKHLQKLKLRRAMNPRIQQRIGARETQTERSSGLRYELGTVPEVSLDFQNYRTNSDEDNPEFSACYGFMRLRILGACVVR